MPPNGEKSWPDIDCPAIFFFLSGSYVSEPGEVKRGYDAKPWVASKRQW